MCKSPTRPPMTPECPNRDSPSSRDNTHWVITDGPRAGEIFTSYSSCQRAMEKTATSRGGSCRGFNDYTSAREQSERAIAARQSKPQSRSSKTRPSDIASDRGVHAPTVSPSRPVTKQLAHQVERGSGVHACNTAHQEEREAGVHAPTASNRRTDQRLVNPLAEKPQESKAKAASATPTRKTRIRTPVMSPVSQPDEYVALDTSIPPVGRDSILVIDSRYRGINGHLRVTRIGRGLTLDIAIEPGREITTFVGTRVTRKQAESFSPARGSYLLDLIDDSDHHTDRDPTYPILDCHDEATRESKPS